MSRIGQPLFNWLIGPGVFLASAEGSNPIIVSNSVGNIGGYELSPDGTMIVPTGPGAGGYGIWKTDATTNGTFETDIYSIQTDGTGQPPRTSCVPPEGNPSV